MCAQMLLEEAVRHGKLELLENLIKENPSIVADFKLKSLGDSLLHEATKFEQLHIVRELMKMDPGVSGEMDKDGFRPLDIAAIMGNLGIVKEFVSVNQDLCLLKGKNGRIPLHYAAIKGRVDVIDLLLGSYPDSVEALTVHAETSLHLAVKYHQFDAFSSLVKWLVSLSKISIINMGDDEGNTVLHLAVITKQYECIDVMLAKCRGAIDVNARNEHGSTVLDVLDIQDSYDINLNHKLENNDAVRSPGFPSINTQIVSNQATKYLKPKHDAQPSESSEEGWPFSFFKFKKGRDSASDTRNALLVVAALIATVCYQAGIERANTVVENKTPIFGSYTSSLIFVFANTLGFTASAFIILYLTTGFPFQRELLMAVYSMMFTYGFAIGPILNYSKKREERIWAYAISTTAFALPYLLRWLPCCRNVRTPISR